MTALLDPPVAQHAPDRAHRRRTAGRERAGLLALLLATAVGYTWSLSASGYANSFYSAAVQAGSVSWKAFLFGSLDSGNSITVDKPPASLWVMDVSVRVFGLSSWSILVPEALMGVATVAIVYATVRRVAGHGPALMAGAATALTPSAALMFRFNNPDALLLLLLAAAGYATLRAAEAARGRWLVLAGVLIGLAFLTKMLQAFLVLPAFVLVYLLAAPTTLRRRLLHVAYAGLAVLVSAGWWVAVVELWPAADRPYIDGSTNNNILELVLGYNGLGRITGAEAGGLGNAGFSSGVGILRLFGGVSGGMVTWLLPAALIVLVGGLVALGRAPRTDRMRAALLLTGGSMVVTGLTFSFMAGIYHDYYTVALAPWIATTAVLGSVVLWRRRDRLAARIVLAAALASSAAWAFALLGQAGEQPYEALRWPVILVGFGAAALLLIVDRLERLDRRAVAGLVLVGALVTSTGPAAYTLDTIGTAHTGSIVTAGPVSSMGGGAMPGGGGMPTQGQAPTGQAPTGRPGGGTAGGGMFDGASVSSELTAALQEDGSSYTWVAATVRASSAASYQLAAQRPVMAIGGFNGTASSPTLAQFEKYVAAGRIHYFIASGDSGMGGPGGGSTDSTGSQITTWVESHFTATTVGGTTVYDLTAPTSGTSGTTGTTGQQA